MNPRRSFIRGFVAGIVLGVAGSLPGLSRVPVTPERPPTRVERVICPRCGMDSDHLLVVPNDRRNERTCAMATMATAAVRSRMAEQILSGDCPSCRIVVMIGTPSPADRKFYLSKTVGSWLET